MFHKKRNFVEQNLHICRATDWEKRKNLGNNLYFLIFNELWTIYGLLYFNIWPKIVLQSVNIYVILKLFYASFNFECNWNIETALRFYLECYHPPFHPQIPSSHLLKKRLWHRCFPVNVAKFSRTFFLQNTSG